MDMKLEWIPRLNNKKCLLYVIYFKFYLTKYLCESLDDPTMTGWVLLFVVVLDQFLYHQCRYNFYNFLELYSTLFETEKGF